ncbi:MAG: LOG family protein [Candidatus Dadabacteria bacterium]|nr:MAG: LOG family protein [Candidatus Dadabacteria bacterium]
MAGRKTKNKSSTKKKKGSSLKKKSNKQPAKDEIAIPAPQQMSRGLRRKHLDERLKALHRRAMLIEKELRALEDNRFYRVCIFGSARIKEDSKIYNDVFELARYLAWQGIDILTGGGPGLMEAANKGARLGREEKNTRTLSFGLSIELEWEPEPNKHLDIKRHHLKFSSRLDDFMRLSSAIVATPGGIGTLLELYFSWQLIQVRHMEPRPIVLMDQSYWQGIIDWMNEVPLKRGLISPSDFDCISIVDTPEEVMDVITEHHKEWMESRKAAK